MTKGTIQLFAKSVRFLSTIDEDQFFACIRRILPDADISGDGRSIIIIAHRDHLDDELLREVSALFVRYSVDMKQLLILESGSNKEWFRNPSAYWYDKVFN